MHLQRRRLEPTNLDGVISASEHHRKKRNLGGRGVRSISAERRYFPIGRPTRQGLGRTVGFILLEEPGKQQLNSVPLYFPLLPERSREKRLQRNHHAVPDVFIEISGGSMRARL